MKTCAMLVSVAALGLAVAGCSSSGSKGSSGSYNSVTGNLSATLDANLDKTYNATEAAVKDMGFRVKKDQKDMTQAVFDVRDAGDHSIGITLKPVTDTTTSVTINQNPVTGSQSTGHLLLDKIKSHLSM